MINIEETNILNVRAEVLVNSVNLKGVMGKGIALSFKNAFPENYKLYRKACESGEIKIGKIFVTETGQLFPKYIINFPTKNHWRFPSKYEYIEEGLTDLVRWIKKTDVSSIAIPPLGSGNGKLNWARVKIMIMDHLKDIEEKVDITIIEPSRIFETEKEIKSARPHLTPARAMLLFLMNKYKVLGYEVNLLVAQKLCYFLQRLGEPLNLRYEKGYYGPFAPNLIPLLRLLNNHYFRYDIKSNKPSTIIKNVHFKYKEVEKYVSSNLNDEQKKRLNQTIEFINGFETPFGLELLGTIDFILLEKKKEVHSKVILNELKDWTRRKEILFKPAYIEAAKNKLTAFFSYN